MFTFLVGENEGDKVVFLETGNSGKWIMLTELNPYEILKKAPQGIDYSIYCILIYRKISPHLQKEEGCERLERCNILRYQVTI
jgi:hypothetical protein